jgi:hypothetical protein
MALQNNLLINYFDSLHAAQNIQMDNNPNKINAPMLTPGAIATVPMVTGKKKKILYKWTSETMPNKIAENINAHFGLPKQHFLSVLQHCFSFLSCVWFSILIPFLGV